MRLFIILFVIIGMCLMVNGGFRVRRRRRRCSSINCSWSSWSTWSPCSVECGNGGSQTRVRTVSREASCGGAGCSGRSISNPRACSMPCTRGTPVTGRCECSFPYIGECCQNTIQVHNCVNHIVVDQPWRSTNHQQPSGQSCDSAALINYWYRFTGNGGDGMPVECVKANRCGVQTPIWMNGLHPTVADGVVTRQVCKSQSTGDGNGCCVWTNNIQVKNCGDFYIYLLPTLTGCGSGFCAGHEIPCPPDRHSQNGYTPCVDNPPTLTSGPILELSENLEGIELDCSFSFPQFGNTTFAVLWYADGVELPTTGVSLTTGRMAILTQHQLEQTLTVTQVTTITCTLTARFIYPNGSPKSPVSQPVVSDGMYITV